MPNDLRHSIAIAHFSCLAKALRVSAAAILLISSQPAAAQPDPVLFELGKQRYKVGDLPPKLRDLLVKLDVAQYRERRDLYEQLAFDAYLRVESKRTGQKRSDIAKELLKFPAPSEADAQEFYDTNRARIVEDFEAVKERIIESLRVGRLRKQKSAAVAGLEKSGQLKLSLNRPQPAPIDIDIAGRPSLGPVDAPFTIVEFADFSCPLCKRASAVMRRILNKFPDRVRWVFMDFPVGKQGAAVGIHEAGHCLQKQNLFWAYHDEVFDRMEKLNTNDGPILAKELGANMTAFDSCYASRSPKFKVKRALKRGRELGVSRTPTVYVNGRVFAAHNLEESLTALIEKQ